MEAIEQSNRSIEEQNKLLVTIGLHHLRRHVGLPRFSSFFTPFTVAHVRYDLATG